MSDLNTTKYLEEVQKRFEDSVEEEDWNAIDGLRLELQDGGFSQEEITLINSMRAEDMEEYKAYQKKQEEYDRDDVMDNDYNSDGRPK